MLDPPSPLGSSNPEDIGKVYVSKKSGETEISFKLLKDRNFDKNSPLNILEIAPLSEDRKKYLYKNIRQYVDESFKDTLCPSYFLILIRVTIKKGM